MYRVRAPHAAGWTHSEKHKQQCNFSGVQSTFGFMRVLLDWQKLLFVYQSAIKMYRYIEVGLKYIINFPRPDITAKGQLFCNAF
jgi:hypothetical protein